MPMPPAIEGSVLALFAVLRRGFPPVAASSTLDNLPAGPTLAPTSDHSSPAEDRARGLSPPGIYTTIWERGHPEGHLPCAESRSRAPTPSGDHLVLCRLYGVLVLPGTDACWVEQNAQVTKLD